jgi:titin
LKFSNLTETTVDLTWKPSKSDGGTPITNYTIEIKESRRTTWGKAGSVDGRTVQFTAKKLVINNEYTFQIKAINGEGESSPLIGDESVRPKRKLGKITLFFLWISRKKERSGQYPFSGLTLPRFVNILEDNNFVFFYLPDIFHSKTMIDI